MLFLKVLILACRTAGLSVAIDHKALSRQQPVVPPAPLWRVEAPSRAGAAARMKLGDEVSAVPGSLANLSAASESKEVHVSALEMAETVEQLEMGEAMPPVAADHEVSAGGESLAELRDRGNISQQALIVPGGDEPEVFLFDNDGTLLDSLLALHATIKEVLGRDVDVESTLKELRVDNPGVDKEWVHEDGTSKLPAEAGAVARIGKAIGMSDDAILAVVDPRKLGPLMKKHLGLTGEEGPRKLLPAAKIAAAAVKEGKKVGVVTAGSGKTACALLTAAAEKALTDKLLSEALKFEVWDERTTLDSQTIYVFGKERACCKPDVGPWLFAAEKLGATNGLKSCTVVDDSSTVLKTLSGLAAEQKPWRLMDASKGLKPYI